MLGAERTSTASTRQEPLTFGGRWNCVSPPNGFAVEPQRPASTKKPALSLQSGRKAFSNAAGRCQSNRLLGGVQPEPLEP